MQSTLHTPLKASVSPNPHQDPHFTAEDPISGSGHLRGLSQSQDSPAPWTEKQAGTGVGQGGIQKAAFKEALTLRVMPGHPRRVPESKCLLKCGALGLAGLPQVPARAPEAAF